MTIVAVAPPVDAIAAPVHQAETGGFVGHLIDAIGVNSGRARHYARLSEGRTWPLSLRLIGAEALLVPAAWVFDLWGGAFHGEGWPAVAGDFASMQAIPAAERPFAGFRPPPPGVWTDLADEVAFYGRVIQAATAEQDFRLVCMACEALMDTIDRLSTTHGLPLPMSRHVVESLGFAAVHALDLGRQSRGATNGLYASFLGFQAMGIQAGIDLDQAALPVHADGVPILVNDLPHIPFREAWEALRRASPGAGSGASSGGGSGAGPSAPSSAGPGASR